MRILGIDPGLETTGYGIIEEKNGPMKCLEAGFIKTSARDPISRRLEKLYGGLDSLISEYSPKVLVLEKLYSHYKHPVTAILMGHARGVVCLLCGIHKLKLVNYPSTKIKKTVTGHGRASKDQVQKMVQDLLQLDSMPEPKDISDALAIAISHIYIRAKSPLFL